MNKAEVLKEIIERRKSTFPKDYTGGEIDDQILNEILASAHFAPSHKKTKPWRFRIFKDDEKAQLASKLAEVYRTVTPAEAFLQKKYENIVNKISKTSAIVTISVNFSGLVPEWEEIAATAMAVQNMYLTCTANKIGCYWSSPGMIPHLGEFLNLEENQKCIGLFYLGNISSEQ